ncbi:glycosyltransferase involved in cell wall biosynthesis [Spirosoma lacussanchae]|uniref:glycosyltransferase family 2 protein n=1 Tax=Spirosoma lacussanchae TaxID=1884249 RepID=UPI001107BCA6|nr:glycosyltransferase family 2 protein [Spirosoma lacussanchae]
MSNNKVSVCIATYNGAAHIRAQLRSILKQLGPNDEIIVSDDNSIDNTTSIIQSFNDSRIIVIQNTSSRGPVSNFENSIRHSSGDYIFLADQDDVWCPNKLEIMRKCLESKDLVLSDCEVVDANLQTLIPSFFKYRGSKPGFWYNLYKNSYVGCCMAFKRSVLGYVLPFPSQIHMHDWWIGLCVELKGSVEFISLPLIKYVRHGENASQTGEESNYNYFQRFTNRFLLAWCVLRRSVK